MAVRISKYLVIRLIVIQKITILYSPNLTYFSKLYSLNSTLFSESHSLKQQKKSF